MQKRFLFICCFLLSCVFVFSQEENISRYVHGIEQNSPYILKAGKQANTFFEFQGYDIVVVPLNNTNEKDIKRLIKWHKLEEIKQDYNDTENNRRIIVSEKAIDFKKLNIPDDGNNIYENRIGYIYPEQKKAVIFSCINERKPNTEEAFLDAYFNNILEERMTDIYADSIDFAGRKIHLGNACHWISPHNVRCDNNKGQISWTEYPTKEEAIEDMNMRISLNQRLGVVLSDTIIDVNFEFTRTKARRVVYRFGSEYYDSPLIVYYIAESVREGSYISCVLSHYGVNKNDYYLAALLQQVMDIPNIPDNAYYILDYPVRDILSSEEGNIAKSRNKRGSMYFSPKIYTTIPLGNLKDKFKSSIGGQIDFGIKTRSKFRFGLALAFDFPIDRKPFIYNDKGNRFETKVSSIVSIGGILGYEYEIKKDLYLDPYITIGGGGLITNTDKEHSKRENEKYEISSFMMSGGVGLRYKKVGYFVEYFFTPYPASKVEKMGNSSIRTGIYFNFESY